MMTLTLVKIENTHGKTQNKCKTEQIGGNILILTTASFANQVNVLPIPVGTVQLINEAYPVRYPLTKKTTFNGHQTSTYMDASNTNQNENLERTAVINRETHGQHYRTPDHIQISLTAGAHWTVSGH